MASLQQSTAHTQDQVNTFIINHSYFKSYQAIHILYCSSLLIVSVHLQSFLFWNIVKKMLQKMLSLNSNNNKVIFLIKLKPYHCFKVQKVEGMLSLMMYFLLPWRNFKIMIHATSLVKKISLNQASLQLFRTLKQ